VDRHDDRDSFSDVWEVKVTVRRVDQGGGRAKLANAPFTTAVGLGGLMGVTKVEGSVEKDGGEVISPSWGLRQVLQDGGHQLGVSPQ